ncbi:MAG: M56 family metallopeptidase [Syntrophomonadaceae bacterium]|nr:M56 family metallopeptidase [Syntrophomonadaceae bacterium]MDD3889024.1 M56 family metallopeptidase [Syntrophomonadaceae bacterium]MDD4549239.1 M56 family metallopeptidase [Syntrophomonadaceae bacterium]
MSSLFLTVLNMSLTASYVALAVIIVRLLLKKAPKIFSYALWVVVLFRLLCPCTFESPLSVLPVNTEAIPYDIIYSPNPAITTGVGIADNAMNQSIQSTLPAVNPAASVNPIGIAFEIGAIIWMLGIIVLLSYAVISYYRLKLRLSTATLVHDNIYATDRIKTPFVLGFIKPRIYIPTDLSGSELSYIIKHEETHIKHYDHIIKPAAFLALTIHWFNPLIWFSYFLMVKDMEMSCDESVMKQSNEDIRVNYSHSLLAFSAKQSGLLSPLSFGESNVKSRIKNVLNYKRPAFWVIIVAVVLMIVVSVGFMTDPKEAEQSHVNAEKFLEYKTDYVGDASKVGNIISLLDYPEKVNYDSFELFTDSIPYAVTVNLKTDTKTRDYYTGALHQALFKKNAIIMFSLIGNVDYINFKLTDGKHDYLIQYTRDWADYNMGEDVRDFARETDEFAQLLRVVENFDTEAAIISLVESFGSKLKIISLQAPQDSVAKSMRDNYSDFVSPTLIEEWINDPLKAPGRLTSSPWPERIDILNVERLSADIYEVKGTIIEITSEELASGGIAASRPITLKVKKMDEQWLIDALTMGEYQNSSGSTAGRVDGKKHIYYDNPDAVYAMYKKALLESDCEIIIALTPSAKPQPYDQEIWDTVKISEVKLLKKDIRKNKACYSLELNIADGGKSAFETGIFPRWLWMSKNENGWSVEGLMTGGEPPKDWWK